MKKILFVLIASLLLFASCADRASENSGDTPVENSAPGGERIAMYDKDGLSFDVPEAWQQNFKAVTREVGSTGNTYPQTDFYYTDGSRDILLMSIGKYTRDQWENLKKTGEDLKDAMLGESGDKNHVYSIRYENHDYIEERDLRDMLNSLKAEAQKLRDKIKIS
ncbi:MAG: hypothetical protein IJP38_09860 [Oscillospiraceae bacterium]|nr:hypothetical protein [Oscillospiraceae bacterium]